MLHLLIWINALQVPYPFWLSSPKGDLLSLIAGTPTGIALTAKLLPLPAIDHREGLRPMVSLLLSSRLLK